MSLVIDPAQRLLVLPHAPKLVLFGKGKGKAPKTYDGFRLAVPEKTLDRYQADHVRVFTFEVPGSSLMRLQPGDRQALVHLIRAGQALDRVFLKQDHPKNQAVKAALTKAAAAGDSHAKKTLDFFMGFNSLQGFHRLKNRAIRLIKGEKVGPGLGLYPADLTKQELKAYILKNLEQAAGILSNESVVTRDGDRLVATPYNVAFRAEFEDAARHLQAAAKVSTHAGFNKYLGLQAAALISSDPNYAYKADQAWAKLEDTPLEFTLGRESYDDELTAAVGADPKVAPMLAALSIEPKSKDMIGARVGVVNREGQELFAKYRRHLHEVAGMIPRNTEYKQNFDPTASADKVEQTLVDVDLVYMGGDYASKKNGGIVLAQNLPNDDKIWATVGGGRRNVFHRSIRMSPPSVVRQQMVKELIVADQTALYDGQVAAHLETIGHEVGHSLGPKTTKNGGDKKTALGAYGDIVEENKADTMSMYMLPHLVKTGELTQAQANSIYVTWAFDNFQLRKPALSQPYPVRAVMQAQFLLREGAISLDKQSRLRVHPEKMHAAVTKMLGRIIDVQLEGTEKAAKAYVDEYFVWDKAMEAVAKRQREINKKPMLFTQVQQPLAEALLASAHEPILSTLA